MRLEIRDFNVIGFLVISARFGCRIQTPIIHQTGNDVNEAIMNPVLLSDVLQDHWQVQRSEDGLQEQIPGIEEGLRSRMAPMGSLYLGGELNGTDSSFSILTLFTTVLINGAYTDLLPVW